MKTITNSVLLEKLVVTQPVKALPALNGTRWFTAVFMELTLNYTNLASHLTVQDSF
jgi:hypothetical protein